MKELFDKFLMYFCFAGIGTIAVVAFVWVTLDKWKMKNVKCKIQKFILHFPFYILHFLIPILCVAGLIVYGSTKGDATTGERVAAPIVEQLSNAGLGGEPSTSLSGAGASPIRPCDVVDAPSRPQSRATGLAVSSPASNAIVRVEKWWRRGALGDGQVLTFDADWCFPSGTNHLTGVEVWASGAVYPSEKSSAPIAELVTKLSLAPHDTEVFMGRTTNNTYRIEWHNGHPNRDLNQTADASIELFRNGNVVVTENGAETEIPYDIPFEHDGFGQDEDWVRANFTNAEEILSIGYADWIDQQVGVGLTNGLYKFTAEFLDDPPEPTQLYIGDYSVCVTNAGEYVFVLEKGTEYEFGTCPFNDGVDYWAQDDLGADAPMLTAWWDGWESPGEWTVDGGWNLLYCPYVYGGSYYRGRCSWWPTLQGSPDVIHLGVSDFPKLFSAMVYDYPDPDSLTFYWNTSDENIHIDSPHSRQTMVSVDGLPSWNHFDLSVSTFINGCELYSTIGSCSYGTNENPQVRLGLNVPKGIPVKGDRLAAGYSFECDVETNGWLVLECTSSTNRVSLWQNATNSATFVCSNKIESASNRSASFYVYGENRSRSYQDVLWKLTFHSASGETNIVSATSTVFGCYCQPAMNDRIPSGDAFYNPCAVKSETDAVFRVDVRPQVPNSNIVWRAVSGSMQFPDGVNRQIIRVRSSSVGDATLGVSVLDYTDERMKFELEVVE